MSRAAEAQLEVLTRATGCAFYRARLGVQPRWSEVAPTRREELVRDQADHPPAGGRRLAGGGTPVRAGTSGSGDSLLLLLWSASELALERRAGARMLARLGIAKGTAIANTLPGALVSPGSLLLGDVVEEYGGLDVPLGAIDSDAAAKQAWELIERVQPAVLCLEAATAARFLAAAPAAERPWLEGLLWLERAGAPSERPAPPSALGFGGWQRRWIAVPEACSFALSSCAQGGVHADESLLAEIGSGGTLLLTPTAGEQMLLRYDAGLKAREAGLCTCGAATLDVGV